MKKMLLLLAAAMLIVTAGCNNSSDQRIHISRDIGSDNLVSNIIVRPIGDVWSWLIGEGIEVRDVRTGTNNAGFLVLQVSGHNKAHSKREFQYKVEWLDSSGMVIDTKTSVWLKASAMPQSDFRFSSVAPTRQAVDFAVNTRKK